MVRHKRFSLGAYNHLKKERIQAELLNRLDTDKQIKDRLKANLEGKTLELDKLNKELRKKEEQIRRRKRKVGI